MQIGGSTFSFMWTETALSAMRKMRQLGLRDFDVITVPGHLWPAECDASGRRELRKALEQEDIRIETLNVPALDFNLGSCLPEIRKQAVDSYADVLRLGAELGGRGVVVVPGRVSSLLPPDRQDTLAWLGDSIERLLKLAEACGQDLLLETHPQTAIATATSMINFVSSYQHPRLLVAYDVANAEFIGEDQVEAISKLAPWLAQVHLSDATRTSWKHDRAGAGSVPFARIVEALRTMTLLGVVIVEVISPDPMSDIQATLTSLA